MAKKWNNNQEKDNDALIQGKAEIRRLFLRKRKRMEEEIKKKWEEEKRKCEKVKDEKLREIQIQIEEEENKAISELEEIIEMELIIKRAKENIAKIQ